MKPLIQIDPLVIPVCVDDESALYQAYDPMGLRLSDGFRDYLEDFIEDRKPGEGVRLELTCPRGFDLEHFRWAFRCHIDRLRRKNHRNRLRRRANALRLLGIGVTFILIGIVFAKSMGEVAAAIVSTVGSFSIWEASAIWIEEMPVITARERILAMLSEAEIIRYEEEAP